MKTTMFRKAIFGVAVVVSLTLAVAQVPVSGQDLKGEPVLGPLAQQERAGTLRGTWRLTVTLPDESTFLSMHTYTASGGTIGINNRSTASPSHGNWVRTGRRQFTVTFVSFRFDAERQFIGTSRVTQNIRLVGPDEYRSVHLVELFDAEGNLELSRRDTGVGRRLGIVDFPELP